MPVLDAKALDADPEGAALLRSVLDTNLKQPMNDAAETAAVRLWRERATIRERERDETHAQARIAAEKLAIISAENDRLSTESARLRAQIDRDGRTRAETEMQPLRCALIPLLLPSS